MSVKIKVYNQKAEGVGELELPSKIFGVKANSDLIHQAIVTQMANEREVLAHVKTRAEVRGGGKKPWKQKGTGRARAGSSRSPLWIGGGVIFGPRKDRNFSKKLNKKMKQKALLMSISDKIANDVVVVLDKFELAEIKTKAFNNIISAVEKNVLKTNRRSMLLINDAKDDVVIRSGRNLKGLEIINIDNINILDVLKYKNLLLTESVIKKLEERYK
jgi:large subunit ribosomal protein L4